MIQLDLDFVRRQFPSFRHPVTSQWLYAENAGGTYVPQSVLQRLERFMIESKVQPYGQYLMSKKATAAIELGTVKMAELINADPEEVVIGHCTTMNFTMLAHSLRNWFQPGDEVIVTNQEHEANSTPWRRLAQLGVKIIEWQMNPRNSELELSDLARLLSRKTRLVCVNHSSNIVGSVNDIPAIAALVHDHGGLILVDGVSYAPHHAVDVKALDVDFYGLSLYKVFGPHLGLLFVKKDHHHLLSNESLEFQPQQYEKITSPGAPNYLRIALNPGGVNHEEGACVAGITDYFDLLYQHHFSEDASNPFQRVKKVFDLIEAHESDLSEQFLGLIRSYPQIQLIGRQVSDTRQRQPTFSFTLANGRSNRAFVKEMVRRKVALQSGCFYAWRCVKGLGLDTDTGVIRVSLVHYNTRDEVQRFGSCLAEIL
ncbi:MAG: aminotransferase class V-fold PLP-dependent enzyme [candidate division KSB1 bacterium]|nr:aminotransferase class V-fold PLP-dependent enzyme [candidate division KSB1 bacterium]MDZ7318000.1 aminotransferase class V-fold PLP-dependent enzyme [candidate division KSB1 bacterium]MDZ7341569.1 aminotransferase class V-fold PLP-dependent enzyme [candidate division KSB1 bacterium]